MGAVVIAVGDDGVEEQGFAELDAVVAGALVFGGVVEQGEEGLFGGGTVGGGSGEVSGERANFGAGDVGDGDCRGVGVVVDSEVDEVDGLIGEDAGFGQAWRRFAGRDEQEDDVVVGGGMGFEIEGGGDEVARLVKGAATGGECVGRVLSGELPAAFLEGLELRVHELVGVGRELVEREVDGGGDDCRGGHAFDENRAVGGVGVGVDGGLAEGDRSAECVDLGDLALRIDMDLELDGALDAGVLRVGRIGEGGAGEGFVLNRSGLDGRGLLER